MNRSSLKFFAAALTALCFSGAAEAQNTALQDLVGNGSPDAAAAPETPMPERIAGSRVEDDFLYVDTGHVVPAKPLKTALEYYKANQASLGNPRYLSVIDYTQSSGSKRFYVIDMRTGRVERFLVAHGRGSDPSHTGYASVFSNQDGSLATSLGFYRTGNTYDGKNGYSLQLYGLSSTNSNAFDRAIVIHGADYVGSGGRSWGCPAVEMSVRTRLIDDLKGGSLIYSYHERFSRE